MIEALAVRNWQSLRAVDLAFGRFTVIVGPSSSGKSALMRALRALSSNVSGTAAITRGASTAAITARTGDAIVSLEYARGAWSYLLTDEAGERRFTKLNRSVPEEITAALGIAPVPAGGSGINYAGQFDGPFLLSASGAAVARELGELTNVNVIYAAVQNANKRHRAESALLRTRRADYERVVTDIGRFEGLRERLVTCDRAEKTAEQCAALADQISRLRTELTTLEIAEAALARSTELPPLPDDVPIHDLYDRLVVYKGLLRRIAKATADVRVAELAAEAARTQETDATNELRDVLHAAGTCPTCEQPITR